MNRQKKIVFSLLFIFFNLTIHAEQKLAQIKDLDGTTNVRVGKGKNFKIVAKLGKEDFFYCEKTNTDWLKIVALKWEEGKQVEGYIYKSNIQFIDDLDLKIKRTILIGILTKQTALAINFQKAYQNKNKEFVLSKARELEVHDNTKYSPILSILPKYFCRSNDTNLLKLFLNTMLTDKGSANETPSFAIGECFVCNPTEVLKEIGTIKNTKQRNFIYDNVEWGLFNYFNVDDDGKSDNKNFNLLKNRLDKVRKKVA